jgi:hypothetical protein
VVLRELASYGRGFLPERLRDRKRDRASAIQVGQAIGMLIEAGPELDPRRNAVLLVAGDKAGQWEAWYRMAIPLAEQRYEDYLKREVIR